MNDIQIVTLIICVTFVIGVIIFALCYRRMRYWNYEVESHEVGNSWIEMRKFISTRDNYASNFSCKGKDTVSAEKEDTYVEAKTIDDVCYTIAYPRLLPYKEVKALISPSDSTFSLQGKDILPTDIKYKSVEESPRLLPNKEVEVLISTSDSTFSLKGKDILPADIEYKSVEEIEWNKIVDGDLVARKSSGKGCVPKEFEYPIVSDNMINRFCKTGILCDEFYVDCCVDQRLEIKYNKGYKYMDGTPPLRNVLEKEDVSDIIKLICVHKYLSKKDGTSYVSFKKLFVCAVKKRFSILCRLMLSYARSVNDDLIFAMKIAMFNEDKDTAVAISWFITKDFICKPCNSLATLRDVWPAFQCNCQKGENFESFCSLEMVIVVEHNDERHTDPDKFKTVNKKRLAVSGDLDSIDIIHLNNDSNNSEESLLICKKMKEICNQNKTTTSSVTGHLAEQIFIKHRKTTLIQNSLVKSSKFGSKCQHRLDETPAVHLYCRLKGFIPVGEDHYPSVINGLKTDVLQGCSHLSTKIRVGDKVGIKGFKSGTLGGFVKVRGDTACLTCCHVLFDHEILSEDYFSFDDEQPVRVRCYQNVNNNQTSFAAGKVCVTPAFETDDPNKTSIDAALVTLKGNIEIDGKDYVAHVSGTGKSSTFLGMKTCFLNSNCVDYKHLLYSKPRPTISAVSVGSISRISETYLQIKENGEKNIDLEPVDKTQKRLVWTEVKDQATSVIEHIRKKTCARFCNVTCEMIDDVINDKLGTECPAQWKFLISRVVEHFLDEIQKPYAYFEDKSKILGSIVSNLTWDSFSPLMGVVHIQDTFLSKTESERVTKRLSRKLFKQLHITEIPFKPGDSGKCIYVKGQENGCIGMAVADHPQGGCIATPIIDILKHFKIRINRT